MSIDSIHGYAVKTTDEFVHNVKWTILSHIRYMMMSEALNYLWTEEKLADESFTDSTPARITNKPIFGVEFMGLQIPETIQSMIFSIAFRSRRGSIRLEHEWAKMSNSRKLNIIHDTVVTNFRWLTGHNQLDVYDFRSESDIPVPLHKKIKMKLLESAYDMDETTGERQSGIDWVYSVEES